ncbi:MAG: NUDIX hydrolase [Candidatus Azambacteria bacterium GW2011_GWA2_45_90]|uniref:NUDIX hydrolase n=2 Tax=Candidatus Azamiibacteriota TaxID=1752741 RepID=A0A0G1QY12_9BACT|nr:MAG: NUDIX hydrolase [Candidatus Azambacteria bacterium GW2011_GWA2_45_90]KKU22688.1 MAG: NUDIX hydrolase [Candidatus Azambacteria bacterium GW2011_GWC1_46_13]
MPEEVCNHFACGMLVKDSKGRYLLIERMKYPIGFACPAGHLEEGESFEQAAKRELKEEVGLKAVSLKEILHEKAQNPCRRKGGDWHEWKIYEIKTAGEVIIEPTEVKKYLWLSPEELRKLASRTAERESGKISESEWNANPGIEPVWRDFFKELGIL